MTDMQIDVIKKYNCIQIRFEGILHFHFYVDKLLGIQSWRRDKDSRFYIEYTFDGGTTLTDYDSFEKWKAILDGLDRAIV